MIVHLLNKKRIIALLIALCCGWGTAWAAYDTYVVCSTGQVVYCNIIDANNHYMEFVYPGTYSNPWPDWASISGNINLPSSCEYGGITYSITRIGDGAFQNCTGLTGSLSIPNSVTEIGVGAFEGCTGFTGGLTISNSVTTIDASAFYGCYGFTGNLVIPNSVTEIGSMAFQECSGFNGNLTIGSSVTAIGNSAFENCTSLKGSLTIPNTVTSIGMDAFKGCSGFTGYLTISNSLSLISVGVFSNCSGLKGSLSIPSSVTWVSNNAFYNCSGFTSISIPNTVTHIGDNAFKGCTKLTSITIPSSVTEIGSQAFHSTGWYNNHSNGVLYLSNCCLGYKGTLSGSLNITSGTRLIASQAFYNCTGLTGSLTLPNSLIAICESAFQGCSGLTGSLTIPNSVTRLDGFAFQGCSGFNGVLTIGNSLGTLQDAAFRNCSNFSSINVLSQTPPTWSYTSFSPFSGISVNKPLTVPCGTLAAYQNSSWRYFKNIQDGSFEIAVSINPSNGGTITGDGNYCSGESCTLSAYANTGYAFVNWTKNGTQVSSNPTYTFTANAADTYVANFILAYEITVTANPTAGGSVTGGGQYYSGSSCTLTATPATGYTFTNWTKGSQVVSTNPTYTFTVNSSENYTANYTLNSYTVSATASPTEGGSVSGTGNYNHGSLCTLTATPASGYSFYKWMMNGTVVSTDAIYSFTVTGAMNLTAVFTKGHLPGVFTVANNTQVYFSVGNLQYKASSNTWRFALNQWDYRGSANVNISSTYNDWIDLFGWGTSGYNHGATCYQPWSTTTNSSKYYAYGQSPYNLYDQTGKADWGYNAIINGGNTENNWRTLKLEEWNWVLNTRSTTSGIRYAKATVNGVKGLILLPDSWNSSYYSLSNTNQSSAAFSSNFISSSDWTTMEQHGAVFLPAAGSRNGYSTSGINSDGYYHSSSTGTNTDASYYMLFTETNLSSTQYERYMGRSVRLVCTPQDYVSINASSNPSGGGTVVGAGSYVIGSSCTLTATPATGYNFTKWTKNGTQVSTSASYTFTVTEAGDYVAVFTKKSYTISASASPSAGGSVSGAGTYQYGSSCTLTAAPATGYNFNRWTKNGSQVSTNASYTFTVSGAATYVAEFTKKTYTVSASANPTAGGTVNGAGIFEHGSTCTLTATPATGYTFTNWKKGNTVVSNNASYQFTVTEAATYIATFTINSYAITASANPTNGGTVTGAGNYNHGAQVTLTATPSEGYHFVNWTKGNTQVSTSPTYSFTATQPGAFVAHFELNSYTLSINYKYANGTQAAPTHTENVNYNATYSVNSPDITGYTADLPVVTGTMGTENMTVNVTYNINSYTLTVNYLYADGTTAATTHTESVNYNATYSVNSPDITGYTADLPVVTGTMGTENMTINVTYNINTYTLTVNYLYADGTTAAATHTENVNYNATYSVASPDITGYTADLTVVTGTMGTENITVDVTYNINTYTLTVNYLYTDGTTAATTHTENVNYNATYSVNSPDITGYTADLTVVTGTMGTENVTVDVTYNINAYTLTVNYLYADGTTAATTHTESVNYNASYSVNSPDITGYTADLSVVTGTMGTENITVDVTYTINSYAIAVSANPSIGGTVTGDGNYDYGTSALLTATPAEGYSFVSWTENDEVVSTSATYSFTVTDARTLMANFSLISYEITATADPTTGGTVTGAGSYNHFENCTLTATTATGYTFVNWTENGNEVSTDATYSFSVTEPRDLVAHFSLNSYEITASANPSIGGTVTGDGTYNHFETCTLTATADEGYTFVNWTENGVVVSTGATYSFTVTDARTLMANFSLNSYVVTATANPSIGGTVTGSGTYNHGETVTLTATARNQYTFVSWTENGEVVSTDNTYIFEVTSQRNLVANFESLNYHWTQPTMSGNMTLGGIVIIDGTLQSADYLELGAFCGNECRGRSLPQNLNGMYIYFLMVAGNNDGDLITFRLYDHHQQQELDLYSTSTLYFQDGLEFEDLYEFTFINRVAITATADPESYGTVAGSGNYFPTLEATLTATPNTGYSFVNWTWNGEVVSTDASYTFTVTEAANYVAHFIIAQYDIVATANPDEGGSISGGGTYEHGQTCTLTATANEGYTFVNWMENGEVVSTSASYDFTVTGARALTANFSLNSYEITATAEPTAGGTIVGNGTYNYLESCTLTATANEGYTFVNWTEDGEVVSTNASFNFSVTGNRTLVAHFSLNSYEIMASADPTAGGIISGAGSYNHFETCTLTATANEGYTFVNWTENGEEVCASDSYDFTVTGARTLTANFSLNRYEIVATANPSEGGTIEGTGTYGHFETCTLTAIANEGYQFNSWMIDGAVVSNNSEYSFVVNGPVVATAVFDLAQTVALSNGWTWWGTSVELSGIDGLTMLENGLGDNGKIIKNSTDFVQNYNTQFLQGWQGNLTSLNNETGYKVKTSAACDVTMVGPSAHPEDHPITLNSNWTWIGYPVSQSQTVATALGNYQPSVNDVIKGQGGYATYLPDVGWMPQYYTLDPGCSYLYYSMNSENQTLVFANGRGDVPVAEPDNRHWRNDMHAFADNLCLMAVVTVDGVEQRSEQLELGAFVDGECRGSARLLYIEPLDRYYAMMTVSGQDNEVVEFALIDMSHHQISTSSATRLSFSSDAICGTYDNPYTVAFGSMTAIEEHTSSMYLYPNPINRFDTFNLVIPDDEEIVELTVVNASGAVVRRETGAIKRHAVTGLSVTGLYMVRVVCKSGNVYHGRLIVR